MLIAVSVLLVTTGSQNAMATEVGERTCPPICPVVLVEEAAEAGNATMTSEPTILAIQHAQSGSISKINATTYTLELSNVSNETIMFSDRPERIVESVSTSNFMGNWSMGQDSFSADPPNAALITENTHTGQLDTAIVELLNPSYDTTTNTLTYAVRAENGTSIDLPNEFGQSILVIDANIPIITQRVEWSTT